MPVILTCRSCGAELDETGWVDAKFYRDEKGIHVGDPIIAYCDKCAHPSTITRLRGMVGKTQHVLTDYLTGIINEHDTLGKIMGIMDDGHPPEVAPAPPLVKDPDPREWCLHPHGDCPYPNHDCNECPDHVDASSGGATPHGKAGGDHTPIIDRDFSETTEIVDPLVGRLYTKEGWEEKRRRVVATELPVSPAPNMDGPRHLTRDEIIEHNFEDGPRVAPAPKSGGDPWNCPNCGRTNEPARPACWWCLYDRPLKRDGKAGGDPRSWCKHPHGDCPYPDHDCDECPDKPSVDSDVDSDVEGALLHDLSRAEQEIDDTRLVASSDKDITLTVEEGRRFLSLTHKCLKCGGKIAFKLDSPRGTCLVCGTVHELGSKIRWEHGRD